MIRTISLILLICCVGQLSLIAQTQERVYVQTDKQLYMSGELLWLKLYTTDTEGKLLSLSKIGYVELIRDSIPEIQIKLDIQDGTGAGWIELPVALPTGYYRMKAYTRYMRNEGEDVFFEKMIAIINPYHQDAILYSDETNTSFSYPSIEKNNAVFELTADKITYTKRNSGEIRLKGLPSENIALGISIAGIDPVLAANPAIEQWKEQQVAQNAPRYDTRYLPEYEGAIIDGVLIDLETGNPAADPQVISLLSFPGKEIQLFAGQLYTNGEVTFYTQCITAKHEVATTAISSSGKKYRLDLQSPYVIHTPANVPPFRPDSAWLNYIELRNLSVQVTHTYSADSLSIIQEIAPCTDYIPQRRYLLDDWTRFTNMEDIFIEFISFARIRKTSEGRSFSMIDEFFLNYSNNVLVLIDNVPVADHEKMITYNPLLVKMIDLHFGQYVFGKDIFDGIIAFYTYQNDYQGITFDKNTQIYDYEGAQPYRYFYAPRYDATSVQSPVPDFRHTLLWEPLIQSNGRNELVIPFTTSDVPGRYVITIEGIGANGTIVNARRVIEVN